MKFHDGSIASLPPLYSKWMDQLLKGPIPAETEATCHACPMCETGERNKSEIQFNPLTKCCSYMPELPNFLIGRIVRDKSADSMRAKDLFDSKLPTDVVVTPLGINPSVSYNAAYRANAEFGRDINLQCPYFLEEHGGLCGIWNHRNARCATWFCKFNRGSTGVLFWKYLDQLLTEVEKTLAQWCVLKLFPANINLTELFPPRNSQMDPNKPELFWGSWFRKEKEFFIECSLLVEALVWNDIARLAVVQIELLSRLVRNSYEALVYPSNPIHLKVAPWKKIDRIGPELYRIWTYNPYDPIDLQATMVDALHFFDGRPVKEAVQRIFEETRHEVQDPDVRRLIDFGILQPCDEPM